MSRARRWVRTLIVAMMVTVSISPVARADDMYQCVNRMHVWDKRQCPEFQNGGPAGFPGSGGGGGRHGGLLGTIGDIVGGLTGGLL